MRVLHIFNELKFSGAEIMYANATTVFEKENIETYAFATGENIGDFEPVFIKSNIKVWHKPMPSSKNIIAVIKYVNEVVAFVKEHNIDIIHIHRSTAKWLFGLIAKRAGVGSMYTVHNVFKHRKITWIKGYLERFTARKWFGVQFQTIGKSVYENEKNYYKTPSIKINNWFDDSRFYPATSNEEILDIRRELGIPLDSKVLISTGGCSLVKNHHDILKAMPLLENSKILYLHLGSGVTECDEKKLAEELGLSDKVMFLGNKNNVRDYLVASDIYLMPSRFEGLGNATLEAMASGVSLILYDVPGLRDLIDNNDNGLLIEESHIKLAESIDWLFNHKTEASIMRENAMNYVNKHYGIENNVQQIIQCYKKLKNEN